MIIGASFIAVLALSATGEIFSCAGRDGVVVFQDKPCADKNSLVLNSKSNSAKTALTTSDLLQLRQTLQKLGRATRPQAAPVRTWNAAAPALNAPPRRWANRGPADQGLLAACSSRIFDCAEGNAPRMDRCVAAIPRCNVGRSAGCCPDDCVMRYLDLRRAQFTPAQSVRDALLDDSVGSCAAR